MNAQFDFAVLIACLTTFVSAPVAAQQASADVTFVLPLNLTRLPAQITEIKVRCEIQSSAFGASQGVERFATGMRAVDLVIPVSQGEVVQTAQVVLPLNSSDFIPNASGNNASYDCVLFARSQSSLSGWVRFNQGGAPAYQLTPAPAPITGSFVW